MSDEKTDDAPENREQTGDAARGPDGRFAAGHTGNAGGRPKSVKEAQDEAAQYVSESIETLVRGMRWCLEKPTATRIREARQCAVAILNRALGMPAQPISGVPGQPVELGGEAVLNILKTIAGEKETGEG